MAKDSLKKLQEESFENLMGHIEKVVNALEKATSPSRRA